jgi:probable HAF family extracellular repeat protein
VDTFAYAINDAGQITGYYEDSNGVPHGFLASVTAPVMSDAILNRVSNLTLLNGTAEAGSNVSVYDGTKLIATVPTASDGTWILQANLTGKAIHSFTETSVDSSGIKVSSAGVTLYASAPNQSLQGGTGNDVLIAAIHELAWVR